MQNAKKQRKSRVAIIGGGVSGVAAALTLQNVCKVDIYERENRLLKKLLKTGNGKANIFNRHIKDDTYNNPSFIAKHVDMLSVVEDFYFSQGVLTYIDEEGRAYPYSRSARSLANHLIARLNQNVALYLETPVTSIEKIEDGYSLNGKTYDYVIITTGSSAYEVKSSLDNGNASLLSSLNLKVNPLRPTSGPLLIEENLRTIENERVDATLTITCGKEVITKEVGEIMFKKDSLSGIASFIVHSRLTWDKRNQRKRYVAHLNLIESNKTEVISLLKNRNIDASLFDGLFSDNFKSFLISRLPKKATLQDAISLLEDVTFKIDGEFSLTLDKGQIMNGGVDINEINAHTFESICHKGLFLGGEVLDIDGISGGYNLMFALYSGVRIAKTIIDISC